MIKEIRIGNFKTFQRFSLNLKNNHSILVGTNGEGKSTILEAIHLALTGYYRGRHISNELSPYLFNSLTVMSFLKKSKEIPVLIKPPAIIIELYFDEEKIVVGDPLNDFVGMENSKNENLPGIRFSIEFNENFIEEYTTYMKDPETIKHIPTEYYQIVWKTFAGQTVTARSIPVKSILIDTAQDNTLNEQKYISGIIKEILDHKQRAELSISFRNFKEKFGEDEAFNRVNDFLNEEGTLHSMHSSQISISLDITQRSNWESSISAFVDDIPFGHIGKGEQSFVKTNLALKARKENHVVILLEEPESHLSFSNMRILLDKIVEECQEQQLIVSTHSSYVLNKMALDKVILLKNSEAMSLNELEKSTADYFQKLPGYDSLRFILSNKVILVEGPADDLIVQSAYFKKYGKTPIEDGIDIISVNGLSFKRYLDIAQKLSIEVIVITDNDGDFEGNIIRKYDRYQDEFIKYGYSKNNSLNTLEPQFVKSNPDNLVKLNDVLKRDFESDDVLIQFLISNKTKWALKVFEAQTSNITSFDYPEYIYESI